MPTIYPETGRGVVDARGQYQNIRPTSVVLVPPAVQLVGANVVQANVIDMGAAANLRTTLTSTVVTTALDVTMEQSADGSTWRSLGTFTQMTAAGSERKCFGPCDRYVRVKSTVTGTTATWGLTAEVVN